MAAVAAEGDAGGADGLDGADGVAFDAGDLDEAADRVAGEPEVVLDADLGGVLDLLGVPPRTSVRAAAAMEQAEPTSPWQPTSAPEMDAFCLNRTPIAPAASRKRTTPSSSQPGTKRS